MPIQFDKVTFSYGDIPVLREFSLTLPEKGAVCLFGPSGCGKSTLLRLLAGLEQPQAGRITGLLEKRFTVVFQENRLLPWISAVENVALALPGRNRQNRERAADWLRLMGLAEEVDSLPFTLSGGMQRRVAIARALAAEGDILLLDEPFTGLDDERRRDIVAVIRKTYADRLVVLVTHSEEEWRELDAFCLRLPQTPLSGAYVFPKRGE